MNKASKIYVAGSTGVVGVALLKKLTESGYRNVMTKDRRDLDLTDQNKVKQFFEAEKPEVVFLAAGRTGSLYANINYPAKFIYDNLMITTNVLHAAFHYGSDKVFYFGCSTMYPKNCPQPMREEAVISGPLEQTSEAFAVAKIAGLMMCDAYNREYGTSFCTLIPTNLYGVGCDYDPLNSQVVPSLIHRFHEAKIAQAPSVTVWGDGTPLRDFLFSSDLADATVFLAETIMDADVFNIGTGIETSIGDLAKRIAATVGYRGKIEFDPSKPHGIDRKLQSIDKICKLGWKPKVNLDEGLALSYKDYLTRDQVY